MKIPISKVFFKESDINSVVETLQSGWIVQGPKVKEFENKWSTFTGCRHSIAVTSCTNALHLSLTALGFGPGDEAIVPAFTWISTANVVEHLGGKVIFCDIDLKTFNIDVNDLKNKISKKSKVIMPVHLFGFPAEMDQVLSIAKENNLLVVEDAACGFGAMYKGQHVGTFGNTGCFSFHPRKSISTGEGGMITTNDSALCEKIRSLRDHGVSKMDKKNTTILKPYMLPDFTMAGYNQRMTDFQAALGLSQLNRANYILQERQNIAKRYEEEFNSINWLKTPFRKQIIKHGYQSYPCLIRPEKISIKNINEINLIRNTLMDKLMQSGIFTRPATHAVHMLSYYANKYNYKPEDYPNSYFANNCSISLPLYSGMKEDEIDYVIHNVKSFKI